MTELPRGVTGAMRVTFYDLRGRTVAELAADLRRRGPVDSAGKLRSAFSESKLSWRFSARANGADCRAADVRVMIAAEVTMPRFTPAEESEPGLLSKWNESAAGLARHEAGHTEIVVRFASAIRERILSLRTRCDRFSSEANGVGNAVVAEMRAAQEQYDAETLNGLRQGTAFPPRTVRDSTPAGRYVHSRKTDFAPFRIQHSGCSIYT